MSAHSVEYGFGFAFSGDRLRKIVFNDFLLESAILAIEDVELGLAPKTARVIRDDGGEIDVPLDQVKLGDRLRARPGEKIPVDGVVVDELC